MIDLTSNKSHGLDGSSPVGGRWYVISSEATFRLVTHEGIEIHTRCVKTCVSLDVYRLIAEFAAPRTPAEVYTSVDTGLPFREFLDVVSDLVSNLVLVPAVEEPIRERSLSELFKDELLESKTLQDKIAAVLHRGSFCVILDACKQNVAEAVRGSLDTARDWRPHEGVAGYFHFKHHNIFDSAAFPAPVRDCQRVLASSATKSFVERLSGEDCGGDLMFGASLYLPGDYSLPHHDGVMSRSVAYVWHLTKDWDPSWGGHLVWCSTATSLNPMFNALILFRVTPESYHFVSPVAPRARGKRLTINGWWTRRVPLSGEVAAVTSAATPPPSFYDGPTTLDEIDASVYASPAVSLVPR